MPFDNTEKVANNIFLENGNQILFFILSHFNVNIYTLLITKLPSKLVGWLSLHGNFVQVNNSYSLIICYKIGD